MRVVNLSLLLGVLILIVTIKGQKSTILSYLVDYQEEQRQDFLELTVKVSIFKKSLQQAIAEARQKAEQIKTLEQDLCRMIVKKKSDCKGSAQIGNVRIEPKYEEQKKNTIFKGISATYEVLITVTQTENFGALVDKILTLEGFVISSIEWQPDQDKIENTFLAESLEKSQAMCKDLGLTFKRLISVQETREQPVVEQEQPAAQEGQEEQQQQQQPEEEQQPQEEENITTYRITVECGEKQKGSKIKTK